MKAKFDGKLLKKDLKKRSISNGIITICSQFIRLILQIGSLTVLARILTPEDYGLVAMIAVVTGFVAMFNDLGLSMATIQREEVTHAQLSNLFWINITIGTVTTCFVFCLSPLISWFYNEPRLTMINLCLSLIFVITSFSSQHRALMQRQMRFLELSYIEILAMLLGVTVAIVGAIKGASYWAIVAMQLVIPLVTTLGVWCICDWRPALPRKKTDTRKMISFGLNVTGFDMINYFSRNLDNLLLGKFYGSSVLGIYNKAYQLMMLPIQNIRSPLNQVALPGLSSLQNDPTRYRKYYTQLISLLAFVSMPLTVFMCICSKEIILLLLGTQWIEAQEIFRVLAITAFIQPIATTRGLVLMSLGASQKYLKWGILNSTVVVIAFCVGLPWGAIGVATGYSVANYAILIPSLIFCFKDTPLNPTLFFKAISKPAIASISMGAVVLFTKSILVVNSLLLTAIYCLVEGVIIYFLVWCLLPGGFSVIRGYYELLLSTLKK